MCSTASSVERWAICWNFSACDREVENTDNFRNDGEVGLRSHYELKGHRAVG